MPVKLSSADLKFTYSKHSSNSNIQKFRGKPDNVKFNRHEEFEMIPMIEKVMNDMNLVEAGDVHIIEDIIHTKIPSSCVSREQVYDWLKKELRGENESRTK